MGAYVPVCASFLSPLFALLSSSSPFPFSIRSRALLASPYHLNVSPSKPSHREAPVAFPTPRASPGIEFVCIIMRVLCPALGSNRCSARYVRCWLTRVWVDFGFVYHPRTAPLVRCFIDRVALLRSQHYHASPPPPPHSPLAAS